MHAWAKKDGRGTAFGSSVEFLLPNGAALSPDAAWVGHDKLAGLTREQRRKFLRAVPDFVAEVMSRSDRLRDGQAKMKDWMDGGVSLAWLINGDTRTIHIYRQGREVEERKGMMKLSADGPIAGFVIDLADLWAGSDRF